MTIEIDGRLIGPGEPCFIIAEIGVNHNGSIDTAMKMIDAIADAGADCVKFQTFNAEEFCNNLDDTYEYLSNGTVVQESMFKMFKRLEIKYSEFDALFARVRERGLIPLSTPTDRQAVDLLDRLQAGAFKIGSDDLIYTPFLRYVAGKGKPMIISTGMANAEDIERAVQAIEKEGNDQIAVLHCVSLYPTPSNVVNLRRVSALRAMFDLPIGYSDHSQGITAALGAVTLGACIVEKHFTLDRNMAGPDHRFSADPSELVSLVREIRQLEANMGTGRFAISPEEREMARLARRSIVAARDLKSGTVLTEQHLAFRRPGTGMLAYRTEELIGRTLVKDVPAGTSLAPEYVGA